MKHLPSEFSQELEKAPKKTSPEHLDQDILACSKEHTPSKQRFYPPWISLAATISIVSIAALLSTQNPDHHPQYDDALLIPKTKMAAQPVLEIQSSEPRIEKLDQQLRASKLTATQSIAPPTAHTYTIKPEIISALTNDQQKTLQLIQTMLRQGDQEQAQRTYKQLYDHCGECGLPQNVYDALKSTER